MFSSTPRKLLFVFAHPDDETLGAGATIAHYVSLGDEVTVLTCTRGERGDVIPERLAHLAEDPAALAAHRDLELREALMALGVTRRAYLGSAEARKPGKAVRMYRDSGMETGPDGAPRLPTSVDPESLSVAPLEEVAGDIAEVIRQIRPDVIVTENAYGGYGHPDHIRVHDAVFAALDDCSEDELPRGVFTVERPARVTARAAAGVRERGTFHPVPHNPRAVTPDKLIDVAIDDPEMLAKKTKALQAHTTQLDVRDGEFGHSDGRGEPITSVEYFRERGGAITRSSVKPQTDFIDGWDEVAIRDDGTVLNARTGAVLAKPVRRWADVLTVIVAVLAGAVLGALSAVGHRATLSAGSVDVPVGFVLTLVAIILAHVAVRLNSTTRLPTFGLAVGTIVAIAILNLPGPGGSVIFPAQNVVLVDGTLTTADNVASIIWLVIAAMAPIIVAMWPRGLSVPVLPDRG